MLPFPIPVSLYSPVVYQLSSKTTNEDLESWRQAVRFLIMTVKSLSKYRFLSLSDGHLVGTEADTQLMNQQRPPRSVSAEVFPMVTKRFPLPSSLGPSTGRHQQILDWSPVIFHQLWAVTNRRTQTMMGLQLTGTKSFLWSCSRGESKKTRPQLELDP